MNEISLVIDGRGRVQRRISCSKVSVRYRKGGVEACIVEEEKLYRGRREA